MHRGSIYAELLVAALADRDRSEVPPSIDEVSAELVRTRNAVDWGDRRGVGGDFVTLALVDQVAYDVALVRCARCLGIDVDIARFGHPHDERLRLERQLADRGIPVG